MKINNYNGLKKEVADGMQFAVLMGGDCYRSFYLDPDCGEWYSAREADRSSVPEDVWNGHDIRLYTIDERYFSDSLEEILENTEDPSGLADKARDAYLKDKLNEEMPEYVLDISDGIDDLTDRVMDSINDVLDAYGFDYDD